MAIIPELVTEVKSTIQHRKEIRRWQTKYDKNAPKAGDIAPDFTLADITGTNAVTLYDFRGHKPVVLVFGSYT